MNIIGQRLKKLREQKKLSQEDIAKILGVSRTTYLKYESGENHPVRKLHELARLYDVSFNYILGYDLLNASPQDDVLLAEKPCCTDMSSEEIELIKKYRTLDEYGKQRILNAIKFEFEQITSQTAKQ